MHIEIHSATTIGIDTHLVEIEIDLSFGSFQFFIPGLSPLVIKESKQRIQSALKSSGIKLPKCKITINLAHFDLKRIGTSFDLPIALGILQASQAINIENDYIKETIFLGELSLNGTIKPIKGILPIANDTKKFNKKRLIIPKSNLNETTIISDIEIIGISNLIELINFFKKEKNLEAIKPKHLNILNTEYLEPNIDFNQIKIGSQTKRAMQISAAGRHNILFVGNSHYNRIILAKTLLNMIPPMNFNEILETSKIYSIVGKLNKSIPLITKRPFRTPHHTISKTGLIGGGTFPQPGEISLAHNGILLLDELSKLKKNSLEALSHPLKDNNVLLSKNQLNINFPANFLLVAILNPCKCGSLIHQDKECSCSQIQTKEPLNKISESLLNKIDLKVSIDDLKNHNTNKIEESSNSKKIYSSIQTATRIQESRFNGKYYNNNMNIIDIKKHCKLTSKAENMVKTYYNKLHISSKNYYKILKIARTISDLENIEIIDVPQIKEALHYGLITNYTTIKKI